MSYQTNSSKCYLDVFHVHLEEDCLTEITPLELRSIKTRMPILVLSGLYRGTHEENNQIIIELAKSKISGGVLLICSKYMKLEERILDLWPVLSSHILNHVILFFDQSDLSRALEQRENLYSHKKVVFFKEG